MATQINLDTSQRVDITCRRGDTFSLRLTLTDATDPSLGSFNSTDSFLMQVRDADTNDTTTVIDVPPVTGVDPTVTTHIDFTVAATDMKLVPSGLYVYDIEQETDTGVVVTLIYGTFKVNEDVSITT
jgi:hypothetical protein